MGNEHPTRSSIAHVVTPPRILTVSARLLPPQSNSEDLVPAIAFDRFHAPDLSTASARKWVILTLPKPHQEPQYRHTEGLSGAASHAATTIYCDWCIFAG
jgi:hypothetical protein